MMRLAILSPAYPPVVNGLGDYAVKIGSALIEKYNVSVLYLGLEAVAEVSPGNYQMISKTPVSLCETLVDNGITHILVNYSNYGYQKKGVPGWLVRALRRVSRRDGVQILTFFHEIYASGKPWQSSFWLHTAQKRIFRKIYTLSNCTFCSNERVANLIARQCHDNGRKNSNIGIVSNIPEPASVLPWSERAATAVVFGTAGRRKGVYSDIAKLNHFIAVNGITKVIDVGRGDALNGHRINCTVQVHGEGTMEEVAAYLRQAGWGFIDYPCSLLAKSGIFSSYATYGLVPVNFTPDPGNALDNLQENRHFTRPAGRVQHPEMIANNVQKWYEPRNLHNHVETILTAIRNCA